jgi:hypothetical protein
MQLTLSIFIASEDRGTGGTYDLIMRRITLEGDMK